jgi:2-dehydrotetronate isomerase
MIRYSANLGLLWDNLPLIERMERAALAGFRAVEMHWPYDVPAGEVRAAAKRLGLALVSVNAPLGGRPGDFGLAAQPGRASEFRETVETAIEWARHAGFSKVHVLSGRVDEVARDEALRLLIENLRIAADLAEAESLFVLIEPMNPVDRPGYFFRSADEAVAAIEAVGRPNLGLLFDTYHAAFVEEDVAATLRRVLAHVGHVQIAAHPDRDEPDLGTVDHRALLDMLAEAGWSGHVGAEYRARGTVEDGLGWIDALGSSATL